MTTAITQFEIDGSHLTTVRCFSQPIELGLGLSECCDAEQRFTVRYSWRLNTETNERERYAYEVTTYCVGCESECAYCPNVMGPDRGYYACSHCESCEECCECFYCESGDHMVTEICDNTNNGTHCSRHCVCITCDSCGTLSESYYCDSCGTCSCGECDDDYDSDDGYASDIDMSDIAVPFTYVSLGESFASDGRQFGVELEITGMSMTTAERCLLAAGLEAKRYGGTDVWAVVDDSSVSNGCEVRTPILRGMDGFLQLRVAIAVLVANGARVDESCGTHVHHDMTGSNGKELAAVCRAYRLNQTVIDSFALRSESQSNGYARINDEKTERDLIAASDEYAVRDACYYADRYKAVNVRAFPQHSTLEFRQHAGSLDYAQLKAWILFGQALITGALRDMLHASANTADVLLRNLERYGLPQEAREQLAETARKSLRLNRGYVR